MKRGQETVRKLNHADSAATIDRKRAQLAHARAQRRTHPNSAAGRQARDEIADYLVRVPPRSY